ERLRQDGADRGRFDDGADRTAGDDAGALRRRAQHHARRTEVGDDLMRDGPIDERNEHHVLLGVLATLVDRARDLVGLAQTRADVTAAVADDDDRGEREAPPALHDLRYAVYLDDPFGQLQAICVNSWHRALKPQPRASGGVAQRFDSSVIAVPAALEDRLAHAPGLRLLATRRPDRAGLAPLPPDTLAGRRPAPLLVRLGLAEHADLHTDLTDRLFVDGRDLELLPRLHRERAPRGRIDLDRMREAERERQLLP